MGFVALGWVFLRDRSRQSARRLFLASILYLPVVLGLGVIDMSHRRDAAASGTGDSPSRRCRQSNRTRRRLPPRSSDPVKVPAIIRSGWWVALAAAVCDVDCGRGACRSPLRPAGGGSRGADFDLADTTVPRKYIVRAMNRDGVRALVAPAMVDATEVDRFNREERGKMLVPDDRVIGIEISGDARAYPLRLMRWHEVVNDVVGGEPIAVTYSPLCDSVAVFSREVDGEVEIELGVSGLLYNSNTLLYDRRSGPPATPLWVQLDGRPVAGPAPGHPSAAGATSRSPWTTWEHPGGHAFPATTAVLAPLPEMKRLYKRDPYHSYFGSDLLRFPVEPLPPAGGPVAQRTVWSLSPSTERTPRSRCRRWPRLPEPDRDPLKWRCRVCPCEFSFDADLGVANRGAARRTQPSDGGPLRCSGSPHWYALGGTTPVMIPGAG